MHEIQYRLAMIQEREAHLRSIRLFERAPRMPARSIRARLGESIIRLGRRVAGEVHSAPVWSG